MKNINKMIKVIVIARSANTKGMAKENQAAGKVISKWLRLGIIGLFAISLVAALPVGVSAGIVDLGTLGGGSGSNARAVNDSGQVVGVSKTADGQMHAFSWTQSGGMVDLGTLGGGSGSNARAVNDSGQVVGEFTTADGQMRAFSWTQSGGMVDLGTLGGGSWSMAAAVNDSGQVVGNSTNADNKTRAFSWTQSGGIVDLGTLGLGSGINAIAVNSSGQVVGGSATADGQMHAYSWTQSGGMVDLGTLGGSGSNAMVVNDSGQVVGWSMLADGQMRAFSWTQSGGMVDLGTLGGNMITPMAVNSIGQVVGGSATADGQSHAFSWTQSRGMVDLGTLGGSWSNARAVNSSGQVVGESATADGQSHAFSWTQSGGMVDLGTLGGNMSTAMAVNSSGQVVGNSMDAGMILRAVLWLPNQPPTITNFMASPSTGTAPLTVTFSVAASDPDGTIASVQWDFDGNGSVDHTTTDLTASFMYTTIGTFTPIVTVIDNGGATASAATGVVIIQNPAQYTQAQVDQMVNQAVATANLAKDIIIAQKDVTIANLTQEVNTCSAQSTALAEQIYTLTAQNAALTGQVNAFTSLLDTKYGDQVFDYMRSTVQKLTEIKNPSNAVMDNINSLVDMSKKFAEIAIDRAINNNGDPKKIANSQKEMEKAQEDIVKGKLDNAINDYKSAWKKAVEALK